MNNNIWLSSKDLWLYGSLGGVAPVLVSAATTSAFELGNIFKDVTFYVAMGFAVKTISLMLLGGFVCFLYKNVDTELRAFFVGIAAPALITTGMASSGISSLQSNNTLPANTSSYEIPSIINSAYAQAEVDILPEEELSNVNVVDFELKQESILNQFLRGFLGWRPPGEKYVIFVNTAFDRLTAKKYAVLINFYLKEKEIPGNVALYDARKEISRYVIALSGIDESKITDIRRFEYGEAVKYGDVKIRKLSNKDIYVESIKDNLDYVTTLGVDLGWEKYSSRAGE